MHDSIFKAIVSIEQYATTSTAVATISSGYQRVAMQNRVLHALIELGFGDANVSGKSLIGENSTELIGMRKESPKVDMEKRET